MLIDEFVTELKVYLKIEDTDIKDDDIITQAAYAADGFISANYSFHILDSVEVKEEYLTEAISKIYLDSGPTTAVTSTELEGVEVTDNDPKVINNVAYFPTDLGVSTDLIKVTSTVGVLTTDYGTVAQATALAGYFFKQADKGLVGVEQYGTGIKEAARLYEGIPRSILNYFDAKRIFRL